MKLLSKGAKVGIAIVIVALIIVLALIVLGKPVPELLIPALFAGTVICFVSSLFDRRDRS